MTRKPDRDEGGDEQRQRGRPRAPPPVAARRAPARAGLSRADAEGDRGARAHRPVGHGCWKPAAVSTAAPGRGQHVVDERRGRRGVGALGQRRDRVAGRGVDVGRDLDALDLVAGGEHVGHVDDPRVDLAELHLAEHRLHVGLEGHRRDGDLGVGEDLLRPSHRTAPGAGTARSSRRRLASESTPVTLPGFAGGTAISMTFVAKIRRVGGGAGGHDRRPCSWRSPTRTRRRGRPR